MPISSDCHAQDQKAGSRAASLIDKILKGAKPADIPVERPTRIELVINLKAAKAMDFTFPSNFLTLANEVVE
jgi:putative ABC transport system substrate-binding protein